MRKRGAGFLYRHVLFMIGFVKNTISRIKTQPPFLPDRGANKKHHGDIAFMMSPPIIIPVCPRKMLFSDF